ncbi:MAG: hypothetical protein ACD_4C00238G0007 [uncultured bacterium (gcode 4)]|uniref:Oxidized purine nucleoside triphosphate hydrolase n=1 Tax=uncultured bacterium (gcode 4) TaxID=1234023 RepID=K2FUI1_9BACT|nr:MAG: hypothetical protein ACD_4C00238G0007 [uncultured bacterium (gcode 4)]
MNKTTIVLIFDNDWKILLCMKKRWFWMGKWNWPGWKVKENEEIIMAAKRELEEETGIVIESNKFISKWKIYFSFQDKSEWDQEMSIFIVNWNELKAIETDEMKPKWFKIWEIPYNEMWEADKYWIPRVINWDCVEYKILFDVNWKLLNIELIK